MNHSLTEQPSAQANGKIGFYRRLCTARYFEGVIAGILRSSGYRVFPYGHEHLLPTLRETFKEKTKDPEPVEERLRSNPDLLVVAPQTRNRESRTTLVEVKFRNWAKPQDVRLGGISRCQRNWPEAVLVVILPAGDVFYAQIVKTLSGKRKHFNLTTQFARIDVFFPNIQSETLDEFAQDVKRFAQSLNTPSPRPTFPTPVTVGWSLMV